MLVINCAHALEGEYTSSGTRLCLRRHPIYPSCPRQDDVCCVGMLRSPVFRAGHRPRTTILCTGDQLFGSKNPAATSERMITTLRGGPKGKSRRESEASNHREKKREERQRERVKQKRLHPCHRVVLDIRRTAKPVLSSCFFISFSAFTGFLRSSLLLCFRSQPKERAASSGTQTHL